MNTIWVWKTVFRVFWNINSNYCTLPIATLLSVFVPFPLQLLYLVQFTTDTRTELMTQWNLFWNDTRILVQNKGVPFTVKLVVLSLTCHCVSGYCHSLRTWLIFCIMCVAKRWFKDRTAAVTSCCIKFYFWHCFNIHIELNFWGYLKLVK